MSKLEDLYKQTILSKNVPELYFKSILLHERDMKAGAINQLLDRLIEISIDSKCTNAINIVKRYLLSLPLDIDGVNKLILLKKAGKTRGIEEAISSQVKFDLLDYLRGAFNLILQKPDIDDEVLKDFIKITAGRGKAVGAGELAICILTDLHKNSSNNDLTSKSIGDVEVKYNRSRIGSGVDGYSIDYPAYLKDVLKNHYKLKVADSSKTFNNTVKDFFLNNHDLKKTTIIDAFIKSIPEPSNNLKAIKNSFEELFTDNMFNSLIVDSDYKLLQHLLLTLSLLNYNSTNRFNYIMFFNSKFEAVALHFSGDVCRDIYNVFNFLKTNNITSTLSVDEFFKAIDLKLPISKSKSEENITKSYTDNNFYSNKPNFGYESGNNTLTPGFDIN